MKKFSIEEEEEKKYFLPVLIFRWTQNVPHLVDQHTNDVEKNILNDLNVAVSRYVTEFLRLPRAALRRIK